jgi:hypothetical protein
VCDKLAGYVEHRFNFHEQNEERAQLLNGREREGGQTLNPNEVHAAAVKFEPLNLAAMKLRLKTKHLIAVGGQIAARGAINFQTRRLIENTKRCINFALSKSTQCCDHFQGFLPQGLWAFLSDECALCELGKKEIM